MNFFNLGNEIYNNDLNNSLIKRIKYLKKEKRKLLKEIDEINSILKIINNKKHSYDNTNTINIDSSNQKKKKSLITHAIILNKNLDMLETTLINIINELFNLNNQLI